jgi:hypothetical protein
MRRRRLRLFLSTCRLKHERKILPFSSPQKKRRRRVKRNNRQQKHREVAAGALVGHFTARGIYGNRELKSARVCVHERQGRCATAPKRKKKNSSSSYFV